MAYNQFNKPDYVTALSKLQHLTNAELQELSNDDQKLNQTVQELQQVKGLKSEKDVMLASNKSLAEHNLAQEPELIDAKQKLQELHNQANDLIQIVKEKQSKIENLGNRTSLDTVLAILQAKAAETEEESEKLADKFLDGSEDVEAFLEDYRQIREAAHLRRVKAERMAEILTSQRRVPSQRETVASQPPVYATPYPTQWPIQTSYYGPPPMRPNYHGMPMPMQNH